MTRDSLVVIGSANTDLVIRLPGALPGPGETRSGGTFHTFAGGKGANQAVAAARAGTRVRLVANIGRDRFGDANLAALRREGIDTRHVARSRTRHSGMALILVDAEGENLIGVARGSNAQLLRSHIDAALPVIRRAGCLLIQLEIPLPTVRRAIDLARQHEVPVVLNPAPVRPIPDGVLSKVGVLTPNEHELAALTGRSVSSRAGIARAAAELLDRGPAHVLATLGCAGVCWASPAGIRWFPAFKARAVDTVGAGDCFNGAFAAAFVQGRPMMEAIRFAIAASAICVTRPGAQASMPARAEILRRMAG